MIIGTHDNNKGVMGPACHEVVEKLVAHLIAHKY